MIIPSRSSRIVRYCKPMPTVKQGMVLWSWLFMNLEIRPSVLQQKRKNKHLKEVLPKQQTSLESEKKQVVPLLVPAALCSLGLFSKSLRVHFDVQPVKMQQVYRWTMPLGRPSVTWCAGPDLPQHRVQQQCKRKNSRSHPVFGRDSGRMIRMVKHTRTHTHWRQPPSPSLASCSLFCSSWSFWFHYVRSLQNKARNMLSWAL